MIPDMVPSLPGRGHLPESHDLTNPQVEPTAAMRLAITACTGSVSFAPDLLYHGLASATLLAQIVLNRRSPA